MQHADNDAGWRLGRRDSGLNLHPKTQTARVRVRCFVVTVRVRVMIRVRCFGVTIRIGVSVGSFLDCVPVSQGQYEGGGLGLCGCDVCVPVSQGQFLFHGSDEGVLGRIGVFLGGNLQQEAQCGHVVRLGTRLGLGSGLGLGVGLGLGSRLRLRLGSDGV